MSGCSHADPALVDHADIAVLVERVGADGAGDADIGVGGLQGGFGAADVRAAFEQ